MLQDAPHRHEWMSDCSTSYVIEEDHERRTQIAYHRTKAPWPVADRDSINRAEIVIDLAARRILLPFEAIDHPKARRSRGVVRMPFLRGHWVLTPVREGGTEVEYQVHANPGGSLPDWLANVASKKLPHDTPDWSAPAGEVSRVPGAGGRDPRLDRGAFAVRGGRQSRAEASPDAAANGASAGWNRRCRAGPGGRGTAVASKTSRRWLGRVRRRLSPRSQRHRSGDGCGSGSAGSGRMGEARRSSSDGRPGWGGRWPPSVPALAGISAGSELSTTARSSATMMRLV